MIKISRIKVPRTFLLFLGTSLAVELYVAHADVATAYWDPTKTGGSAAGGTGTWDGTSLSWSSAATGGTDGAWFNGNNAVFAGAGNTVTLGAPITVGNLTINSSGYTIATSNGDPLTVNGGITTGYTSTGASNITGTGGLVMNGNQTINVADGGVGMNISTVLSGSGVITKAGAGSLGLNQANTFSGNWVVTGGLLGINSDAALGADPTEFQADNITLNGGGLATAVNFSRATGFSSVGTVTLAANRGITLGAAGGTFRVGFGTDVMVVNGAISGVGSLTKIDSGTLILNGDNTYQGATNVTGGRLILNGSNTYQGGTTISGNGIVQVGTGGTTGTIGSGDINFGSGKTNYLYFDRSDDVTVSNNITGPGWANIGSMNGGRVILTGAFVNTGAGQGEFWINGNGTVVVVPNANTSRTSNTVIVGGMLEASDISNNVNSALGTGNLYMGQSGTASTGAGLRYTGDSVSTAAIQSIASLYVTMEVTKPGTVLTTTSTIKGSNASSLITKIGPGTWDISGTTDDGGLQVAVSEGTLLLDKASTSGVHAVSGLFVNGGLAQLAGSGEDQIYDGSVVQVNGGVLDLNGHSEAFAGLSSTASAGVITNNLSGTSSTVTVSGNNNNFVYSGKIQDGAGQVSLVKSGSGVLTLTNDNNITGSTELKAGRLIVSGSLTGSTTFVEGGVLGGTGRLGDVTVIAGTFSPGATATGVGLGTLHTGSLDLTGAVYEGVINTSTLAASLAEIQGDLTVGFSGALLTLTDLGSNTGDPVGTKFTLMSYTGFWDGGTFNFGTVGFINNNEQFTFGSNTFQLTYDAVGPGPNEHDVILTVVSSVPEPASAGLLLGGVALLAGRRRRKSGGLLTGSITHA